MLDLVIRNGTIVDGTGAPAYRGDVGIEQGSITRIGAVPERGREEIDAAGHIVTPGFVDVHSHYDGQVTWDTALAPSSKHGATTVVMGNCGVGFAPVRPGEAARRELIELMEGVEDIPGTALWEGIDWRWESFPEYLDAVASRGYALDVGALVPHGALRVYVMGARGRDQEAATDEDIATMARLAAEGVRAGAMGFSTNRILGHQSIDGAPVPGTFAADAEMMGIGRAVAAEGGMFQLAPGGSVGEGPQDNAFGEGVREAPLRDEIRWMGSLSRETGMKMTFLLAEHDTDPDAWKTGLALIQAENARGARLFPQVAARSLGMLLGFQGHHMFERRPTYMRIASLPYPERLRELARPEVKAAILAETGVPFDSPYIANQFFMALEHLLHVTYPLGDPPRYDPTADMAIPHLARQRGVDAASLVYDLMLENQGTGLLLLPSMNYSHGNEDAIHAMLTNPATVLGLADGGAHCSVTCDGSAPTYMLSHWVRDRTRGPRLTLEAAVAKQTSETAALFGLRDRGTIALGRRADLNVIDFDNLALLAPYMIQDLPAGGSRMMQDARGYAATIVAGTIVRRDDTDTGLRPGRLLRRRGRPGA